MILRVFTLLLLSSALFGQTTQKLMNRALSQPFCLQTNISGTEQDFLCGSGTVQGQVQLGPTVGQLSSFSGHKIRGVSDGTTFTAGHVGEYISSVVGATTAVASATWGDCTSLSIPAGDWDVSLLVSLIRNGATYTSANFSAAIGQNSGTNITGLAQGDSQGSVELGTGASVLTFNVLTITIPGYRQSLSSSGIIFAKIFPGTYTGTAQMACRISARRVR